MSDLKTLGFLVLLALAGCVTTTTGPPPRPEADKAYAAELNYQLGARYFNNGSYELARDRLVYSLELDPKNAVTYSVLALTYEKLDNIRLATESYENAARLAPRDHNVLNTYAVFLCRQRDFENALKYFDRAIKIRENDDLEVTLTNAGVCLVQKPDLARAETYLRAALERRPNYGEALIQLSLLKIAQDDYLGARAFLQRYLGGNLPTPDVLYLGMQIEDKLGDERARVEYSNRVLREFPQSPEAKRILESTDG
jgi:type IV pilus assembly protein PilF